MRLWRWGNDFYDTGYRIFTLVFSKRLGIDLYLFHYKQNSYIPKHKDPGHSGAMYRLNIELVKAKRGGQFHCKKLLWTWHDRIYFFRADNSYHYVTRIEEGSRWVLSFGKVIRNNE